MKTCRHGHDLTPENTYHRPSDGFGECRTCRKNRREKSNAVRSAPAAMTIEARDRKRERERVRELWRTAHRRYLKLLQQRGVEI